MGSQNNSDNKWRSAAFLIWTTVAGTIISTVLLALWPSARNFLWSILHFLWDKSIALIIGLNKPVIVEGWIILILVVLSCLWFAQCIRRLSSLVGEAKDTETNNPIPWLNFTQVSKYGLSFSWTYDGDGNLIEIGNYCPKCGMEGPFKSGGMVSGPRISCDSCRYTAYPENLPFTQKQLYDVIRREVERRIRRGEY